MMIVTVKYHQEDECAWAESPDVEGLSVAGESLAEVRRLVRDGLPFYLDAEFELVEEFDEFAMPGTGVLVGAATGTSGGATLPSPVFAFASPVMPGATGMVKSVSAFA